MNHKDTLKIVEQSARLMGLHGWTWSICKEPSASDEYATIECVYGQRHGIISLSPTWSKLSKDERYSTIVHELVHAHFAMCRQLVHDVLDDEEAALKAWDLLEEYTVEAIAQAWYQTLKGSL